MLNRQTAHRPKREIQDIRASEVAELRAENQRLKRENARLRRQLEKYTQTPEPEDNTPEPTLAESEGQQPKQDNKCPDCGGTDLTSVALGPKTYLICKTCKWRKGQ